MSTMAAEMTDLEAVGQSCLCMKVAAALAAGLGLLPFASSLSLMSLRQSQSLCG